MNPLPNSMTQFSRMHFRVCIQYFLDDFFEVNCSILFYDKEKKNSRFFFVVLILKPSLKILSQQLLVDASIQTLGYLRLINSLILIFF